MSAAPASTLERRAPAAVLRAMELHRDRPDGVDATDLDGVVLCVDLSGLAPLLDPTSRAAPRAAEDLAALAHQHLQPVVDAIGAYGGALLDVGPERITAIWRVDGPTADAALPAIAAAVEATQVQTGGQETAPLHARAAVVVGGLRVTRVGGHGDRWKLLMRGDALNRARRLARETPGGGVLLDQAAATAAADAIETMSFAGRGQLLTRLVEAVDAPTAGDTLPPGPQLERWKAALASHQPEGWRSDQEPPGATTPNVSVAAVRVRGLDLRLPGADAQLQAVVVDLQRQAARLGGAIEALGERDAQIELLVWFGLPGQASSWRAEHAVLFALAASERLVSHALEGAVAVASSRVLVAALRGQRSDSLLLTGAARDRAAAILRAQGDGVVVDANTARAAWAGLVYEPAAPIRMRGSDEPLLTWRATGLDRRVTARAERQPDLVGRQAELDLLRGCVAAAAGGQGGVVLLEGPAGIGKSRLLAEITADARDRLLVVLRGEAGPLPRPGGYAGWEGVFDTLLDLDGRADPAERADVVQQRLLPGELALLPLLLHVCALEVPESDATRHLVGRARAERTDELLLALLARHASRAPTLIVLDDTHWLDSAGWRLALRAARQLSGVLFILAGRGVDEGDAPDRSRLLELEGARLVDVGGLARDEATHLAAASLLRADLPIATAEWLHRTAQGNPYYVVELAFLLEERGLLGGAGPGPDNNQLEHIVLPPSLEAVVTERIDRLADLPRAVLRAAAVLGPTFPTTTLGMLGGWSAPELAEALADLALAGLLAPVGEADEPTWAFQHAITRDAAERQLGRSERRQLHQALATRIEETEGDHLDAHAAALAWHWTRAEDAPRALRWRERSGELALRAGAHLEASEDLQIALELARSNRLYDGPDGDLREALTRRRLADAWFGLGSLDTSGQQANHALRLLGTELPTDRRGWVRAAARQLLVLVGQSLLPAPLRSHLWPDRAREAERALAAERLAERYFFSADGAALVATSLLAVNRGDRAGPGAPVARAYAMLAMVAGFARLGWLANRWFRRAERMAGDTTDRAALAVRWYAEAVWALGMGRWERTDAALARSMAVAVELGDPQETESVHSLVGALHLARGRFGQAHQEYQRLLRSADDRGNAQHRVWGHNALGHTLTYMGRTRQALTHLRLAVEQCHLADFPAEINAWGLLALGLLQDDKPMKALDAAREATARIRLGPPLVFAAFAGICGVAEVYLEAWAASLVERPEAAPGLRREAEQAVADALQWGRTFPIGMPRALVLRGRREWIEGDPAAARRSWGRAARRAEALDIPFDRALAAFDLARHDEDPTVRRRGLEGARRGFHDIGADGYVDRCDALLGPDDTVGML